MARKKVTEKILADAEQEARDILDKYREQAKQFKKSQDDKIAVRKKQIELDIDAAKMIEYNRRISEKKLQLNRSFVLEKRMMIDDIIDEAMKAIPEHTHYLDFLKALIKESGRQQGELMISKKDWQRHGTKLEKFFKDQGCQFKINLDDGLSGGINIKKDKTVLYGSLDIIRELIKDQLIIAVSKKFT
jgi:vacuolar-type H+-ATPase subunit E/Vma4